jgi:hypothetical protein
LHTCSSHLRASLIPPLSIICSRLEVYKWKDRWWSRSSRKDISAKRDDRLVVLSLDLQGDPSITRNLEGDQDSRHQESIRATSDRVMRLRGRQVEDDRFLEIWGNGITKYFDFIATTPGFFTQSISVSSIEYIYSLPPRPLYSQLILILIASVLVTSLPLDFTSPSSTITNSHPESQTTPS